MECVSTVSLSEQVANHYRGITDVVPFFVSLPEERPGAMSTPFRYSPMQMFRIHTARMTPSMGKVI